MEMREVDEREPHDDPLWKFVRWRAHFSLHDMHTKQTFSSLNRDGRAMHHITAAKARERALAAAQQEILASLIQPLAMFVYGEQP